MPGAINTVARICTSLCNSIKNTARPPTVSYVRSPSPPRTLKFMNTATLPEPIGVLFVNPATPRRVSHGPQFPSSFTTLRGKFTSPSSPSHMYYLYIKIYSDMMGTILSRMV